MKQRRATPRLLLWALLCLPGAMSATDFSLLGGIWDDPGTGNENFGVGGRVAFYDKLQLEIGAAYYSDFEEAVTVRQVGNQIEVRSSELQIVPIEAGLRYNFGGSTTGFYLSAGPGWYMVDVDGRGGFGDELGFYATAGWQYPHLFIETIYRDVEGTFGDELGRGARSFDLSGLGVQLGWRF